MPIKLLDDLACDDSQSKQFYPELALKKQFFTPHDFSFLLHLHLCILFNFFHRWWGHLRATRIFSWTFFCVYVQSQIIYLPEFHVTLASFCWTMCENLWHIVNSFCTPSGRCKQFLPKGKGWNEKKNFTRKIGEREKNLSCVSILHKFHKHNMLFMSHYFQTIVESGKKGSKVVSFKEWRASVWCCVIRWDAERFSLGHVWKKNNNFKWKIS